MQLRFPVALALALALGLGLAVPGGASLIVSSRLSSIRFDATNLGTPGGGPDLLVESMDLAAAFDEVLLGDLDNQEPGGAINHGSYQVSQTTVLGPGPITTAMAQSGLTTTDHGSPQINLGSELELVFSVDVATDIRLEGALAGSSMLGADDFARVRLRRGVVTMFSTGFGHLFPFEATLLPGNDYTLNVEISGRARPNDTSFSSANVSLTVVPEPATAVLLGLGLAGIARWRRRR